MVNKVNEKYENLSESEKTLIRTLLESTDEEKKELYSTMVRECIDLIDVELKECDLERKDKLLKVKDKLLNNKQEIDESFNKGITKLVELKQSFIK